MLHPRYFFKVTLPTSAAMQLIRGERIPQKENLSSSCTVPAYLNWLSSSIFPNLCRSANTLCQPTLYVFPLPQNRQHTQREELRTNAMNYALLYQKRPTRRWGLVLYSQRWFFKRAIMLLFITGLLFIINLKSILKSKEMLFWKRFDVTKITLRIGLGGHMLLDKKLVNSVLNWTQYWTLLIGTPVG
jgi:hypothetical protein